MAIPDDCAAMIAKYGESITLRRTATGAADIDVALKGVVASAAPQQLTGNVVQQERQVRISNAEIAAAAWPGPPAVNDGIQIGGLWFKVGAVDTRKVSGAIAMHVLTVRG